MLDYLRQYSPYILLGSAFIIIIRASYLFLYQYLSSKGVQVRNYILILLSGAFWLVFQGLESLGKTLLEKHLFGSLGFIFKLITITLWFYNIKAYDKKKSGDHRGIFFLLLPVLIGVFMASFNIFHEWFWRYSSLEEEGFIRIFQPGYFVTGFYFLLLIARGGYRLFKTLTFPFFIFRSQAVSFIFLLFIPAVVILMEDFFFFTLCPGMILSPYAFLISTWLVRMTKNSFHYRDIIAISRASFFENITDAILVLDSNNRVIDSNPPARLMMQVKENSLKNKSLEQLWPELASYINRLTVKKEKLKYITLEYKMKRHFYDIEISPFRNWDGSLISQTVVLHDITERKETEEALRKSEEKFRNIIKQSIDGILIVDEKGNFIEWNKGMENITGIKKEETLNKPVLEIYARFIFPYLEEPVSYDKLRNEINDALNSGAAGWFNNYSEAEIPHPDGTFRIIQQQTFPIKTSKGYSLGSIVREITEKRQLEEERIKSGKLESLGLLAGGIAHDFNNILTAIIGNLSLIKMVGKDEQTLKLLGEAENASAQAKDLTQQLLTFSKGGQPIRHTTSLVEIIKNAAGFSLRGSNVRYELITDEEIWPVDVDSGQMNQVISNLIINADQAMPNGGVIRISVNNVMIKPTDVYNLSPGRYIKTSIMDEGQGIPQNILTNIFDPYFTTKSKGSGLGLAITYSIIKKHQGNIMVDSIEGIGTNFTFFLKASENKLEENRIRNKPHTSFKGKILIMDDDPSVRTIIVQMLELLGHKVAISCDGIEAIAKYKTALKKQEPFDTVIMDLTVPGGMGGKEAVIKLIELDPDARVIVSSGYSNDPIISNYQKYGFKAFLQKPYKISDVEDVLDFIFE